ASSYNMSLPLVHTLCTRGMVTKEAIDSFLFTSFSKDVAHPSLMHGAQRAVDRILKAIETGEKILVCGDYDVDGITSSAMMMECLLPLGAQINFFLPHRVRNGYGLSSKIIKRAAENDYRVVITVDNGITAFEPAQEALKLGIDLIITDHHRSHGKTPEAYAVINPNQEVCEYPFKGLAGVGVAFKLLWFLYEQLDKELPDKVYELLMLGTIADVVPLEGENRYWVRHGLEQVRKNESLAIKVLKEQGRVSRPKLNSLDVGFCLTPQINALGRLEDAREGVAFLIGKDHTTTARVGKILYELNQARRKIERTILDEIVARVESGEVDPDKGDVIVIGGRGWKPGVIGLVASRLVGLYGKPTLVFHLTKDGKAKGSCRSIDAFNIFDALAENKDLIDQFGGHSQAAGLSMPAKNLDELRERLSKKIKETLNADDLAQKIIIDAPLNLSDMTQTFTHDMALLEPFGHRNPQPTFWIKDVVLVKPPTLLKELHPKCTIFLDGVIKPLIFFNRPELFDLLTKWGDRPFHVAANVTQNFWQGRSSIELIGVDIAWPEGLV
ncbi:single-stranded-DNA-specific exonuclease RecJ, partial [bacterium]|nr:single-stranded-DNA-specific exonuclease RecJ [bacterium]